MGKDKIWTIVDERCLLLCVELLQLLHICSLDDWLLISLDYYCHCFFFLFTVVDRDPVIRSCYRYHAYFAPFQRWQHTLWISCHQLCDIITSNSNFNIYIYTLFSVSLLVIVCVRVQFMLTGFFNISLSRFLAFAGILSVSFCHLLLSSVIFHQHIWHSQPLFHLIYFVLQTFI